MNTNFKLFTNQAIAAITTSISKEALGLEDFVSVEIQVDWASLGGTLDAQIKVSQRMVSDMNYTCLETDESKSNAMVKTMDSASGTHTFLLWAFNAEDIKVDIIKNNCTSGTINIGVGARKR